MPEIHTGLLPPVKMAQQKIDFTDAFDAPESDPERDEIDLGDDIDQEALNPRPDDAVAISTASLDTEPKLPFPNHLGPESEHLRGPQQKWIEAGGNTFSSTETVEEAAARAKLRSADAGTVDKETVLTRKLTHQWEQEERRKLWSVGAFSYLEQKSDSFCFSSQGSASWRR